MRVRGQGPIGACAPAGIRRGPPDRLRRIVGREVRDGCPEPAADARDDGDLARLHQVSVLLPTKVTPYI
jgi:hypothetical protein